MDVQLDKVWKPDFDRARAINTTASLQKMTCDIQLPADWFHRQGLILVRSVLLYMTTSDDLGQKDVTSKTTSIS